MPNGGEGVRFYRTRLYRTDHSSVMTVHRADCRVLARVLDSRKREWKWAEGKPPRELFHNPWNVPCRVCWSEERA